MKCAFLLCDTSELLHYCVQRSDHWNVQATGDLSSLRLASQDLSLLIDPVPEGPDPILNERLIEADVTAPYLYLITCRDEQFISCFVHVLRFELGSEVWLVDDKNVLSSSQVSPDILNL
jgi:hypothetical protein